jgi:hypothetical protein
MAEDTLPAPTKAWHRPVRLFLNILSGLFGTLWIVLGLLGANIALNLDEIANAVLIGTGLPALGALILFITVRAYQRSNGFRLRKENLSKSDWAYVRGSMILGILPIVATPLCLWIAWAFLLPCCAPPPLP